METRTVLKIVLGLLTVATIGISAYLAYTILRPAGTTIVKEVIIEGKKAETPVNPMSLKTDEAIALVKSIKVEVPVVKTAEEKEQEKKAKKKKRGKKRNAVEPEVLESKSLDEILSNKTFISDSLKLKGKADGWEAVWWGETKHGDSYFLVTYVLTDELVRTGPQWLVDLKSNKVIPKNLPALVTANPKKGSASKYYDRNDIIVSTIASHRFENKMTLAGALLLYFESRQDTDKTDTILGWTVDHERGNLFKAYFQWTENKESTYAEFEFDFDAKALKAVNLQAANIMRIGEGFTKKRVSIFPSSYDANAKRGKRWIGAAKKVCKKNKGCSALDIMLSGEDAVIESIEWLLTARANTADEFNTCRSERNCRWKPEQRSNTVYSVRYLYRLGNEADKSISWDVDIKKRTITPTDRIAKLAFSTIRPR